MSHEKIAEVFDDWARSGRGAGMEDGHGDVVAQVVARLDVRPGFQILDLGCGVGWATRLLARQAPGASAVGIDASPEMIGLAEAQSSLSVLARYEQGTFEALDLPDARFDLVFSMEALYYSVDLGRALAEIARVTKPGGTVEVVIDCYEGRPCTASWSEAIGLGMHYLSAAEWVRRFEAAGFEGVRTEQVVDSRGAGVESAFEPSSCFPDWASWTAFQGMGSLWIRGRRPVESAS